MLTSLGTPISSNSQSSETNKFALNFNQFSNKDYIPDFVYSSMCSEETQECGDICSNNVYSPVVDGYVHDPYNGKVFCPFGKGNSMNKSIIYDQAYLNSFNMNNINNYNSSTWGHAPQLYPRQLAKIGLSWRTS